MIALEVASGRIVGESSMPICHMAPAGPTSALAGAPLVHLQCGLTVMWRRTAGEGSFEGINIAGLLMSLATEVSTEKHLNRFVHLHCRFHTAHSQRCM